MKKILYLIPLSISGVILIGSQLQAYDIHHPNPMDVLNGHRTHTKRARPIRTDVKYKIVEVEAAKAKKSRLQPGRMYRRHKERKYIIKPEPFSISSKKADPEILGPQRTYSSENNSTAIQHKNSEKTITKNVSETMTKEGCVSLIGQEKFDSYIEKYNGEAGAIKRCLILKRMRG